MGEATFYIALTALFVLFAGDPNLMDAIQAYLNSAGCRP